MAEGAQGSLPSSGPCSPVQPGVVYLVGAGPGAVGLLTVRAVEVLSSCDAVLHDRLVPPEIVKLAKASAEVRYVGKDAGVATEKMKGQQDDISGQLVQLARKGLSVCRLKGGDPLIYGRAGEEMEELVAAGVTYELVPAVTAALAAGAAACVPLTYRNIATSISVHTMNATTTRDANYDWSQFASPSTTYALYMGLGSLGDISERMIAAGVPGDRPMAVVDRASLPEMQTVAGTLATLPEAVKGRSDLKGPALVLLGSAVGLRERLLLPFAAKAAAEQPRPDGTGSAHFAVAMAALPQLREEELRRVRARIDELLPADASSAA